MKIGELEKLLFEKFPLESAEEWDTTGITSGDAHVEISKIAVALDPSLSAVKAANSNACNLLLTHHPAYIGEIEELADNNIIFSASDYGVALMNFHTALDVSEEGSGVLPNLLNLEIQETLLPTFKNLGFGKICKFRDGHDLSLEQLAKKCKCVFGRSPRVWGDFSNKPKKIVTTTGSVGRLDDEVSVLQAVIDRQADCIICGEIKYHDAVEINQSGISIIDLGHDVSELPLCKVLIESLQSVGIDKDKIVEIDQSNYWN